MTDQSDALLAPPHSDEPHPTEQQGTERPIKQWSGDGGVAEVDPGYDCQADDHSGDGGQGRPHSLSHGKVL